MSAFPRTCRDGLVIFGLATKALPDRCGVRRGPGLWRRFLSLLRAGEALPERWSDRSGGLWHRFLFSRRLPPFLRARHGTAFCLLGFLRHVQPPNGSKTSAPHTAVYLSVLSFSRGTNVRMSALGQKRTCAVQLGMSAKCQKQTFHPLIRSPRRRAKAQTVEL